MCTTREDRRSLALHWKISERVQEEPEEVLEIAQANLVRMRELHPGARGLLDDWAEILRGPLDGIVAALTDPRLRFRELRQVTPFAGVLDQSERSKVYRRFQRDEGRP